MIDVEPRRGSKRPRNRARRVVSTTGREIPDVPMPMSRPAEMEPQRIVTRTAPASTAGAPAPATGGAHFERWDAATNRIDSRYARPHRAHESYDRGEAVLDKVHGMGIVEKVAEDGTLEVLFKRGYVSMPSVPRHLRPAPFAPHDDDLDDDSP